MKLVLGLLVCWTATVSHAIASDGGTYTAAVVEHVPVLSMQPVSVSEAVQIMNDNLDVYDNYTKEAAAMGAQIIVFPEDGLYGAYFLTREWALPYLEPLPPSDLFPFPFCDNEVAAVSSPIAHRAACMARKYGLYIVLVMGEIVLCGDNAEAGPYGPYLEDTSDSKPCPPDGRFQYNTQVLALA